MNVVTSKKITEVVGNYSSMIGKKADFEKLLISKLHGMDDSCLIDAINDLTVIGKVDIEVDTENTSVEEVYIDEVSGRTVEMFGLQEINGFPIFGFNLGGDWEEPVYEILVSDGKELYRYIPVKGNSYNPMYNSAFGNNDDIEEAEDVACDWELIKEDICAAFTISASASSCFAEDNAISDIEDSVNELIDAIEAITDDETGTFVRSNLEGILDTVKKVISEKVEALEYLKKDTDAKITKLNDTYSKTTKELTSIKTKLKDTEDELSHVKASTSAATVSPSDPQILAFKEIATIVDTVLKGGSISTGMTTPSATPVAPVAPPKPLKKISLPTKTISYEYVYGVEMDGSTAILHIIKKDDWNRDELAKEGRVDTETIARLKSTVPFKRDKFVYILENTYSSVEEVVDAVSKATGINLEHSKDVQAKF